MRMRYERRDPRPDDLRHIDELKAIVDSQEKDIFYLTEQLRELQLHQPNQQNQQNANQSKKNRSKNNKNSANNRNIINNISNNGNSNNHNNTQQQMRQHEASQPQQTQQNANHEGDNQQQQQRVKPPPLIKTVIYEEENENELYEQQIREEREIAKQNQEQELEAEMQSQHDGVMVELVPESPDYTTKHKHCEEISEAHIISDQDVLNNIPDVVVFPTPSSEDKLQEIRIEVISTIEPANIEIISNGNESLDLELD